MVKGKITILKSGIGQNHITIKQYENKATGTEKIAFSNMKISHRYWKFLWRVYL